MKKRDGWGRYIARKSMEGLQPPEVKWRKNKIGSATGPNSRVPVLKNLDKIKGLIQVMRDDSYTLHYINEAILLESLSQVEQAKIRMPMPLVILKMAMIVRLFLGTVER